MRHRLRDVLIAKAVVMWLAAASSVWWVRDLPRVATAVVIGACLTTTVVVWLRIDDATDAWRSGYKTALNDVDDSNSKVRQMRR